MKIKILAIIGMIFAGGLFYFLFFILAPILCKAIPEYSWKQFIEILIYIFISYFGGIVIPIVIFLYSLFLFIIS